MRKLKTLFITLFALLFVSSIAMFSACDIDNNSEKGQVPISNPTVIRLNETVLVLDTGEEKTLTATSSDGATDFSWISFDDEIVTVENGKLTAIKTGSTYVIAYIDDIRANCKVTVVDNSNPNLTISADGTVSYKKGDTEAITADLYDGTTKLTTLYTDYKESSFTIHDLIMNYRINNSITEDKSYTIKVKGSKIEGEIQTGVYRAIDTLDKLRAAIKAASKSNPDYNYLTADIEISAINPISDNKIGGRFMLTDVQTVQAYLNLDGQGHSISYGEKFLTSSIECLTLFGGLKNANVKNLVIDLAVKLEHVTTGVIAFYTENSAFTDCYFKVSLNQTGGTYADSLFKGAISTQFNNCVFEIIDANLSDEYNVNITGHESKDVTFTNCAVVYTGKTDAANKASDLLKQVSGFSSISSTNFDFYNSFSALIDGEKEDNTWSNVWSFDADKKIIKLFDKAENGLGSNE